MENVALSANSSEGTAIGVHRREKHARIGHFPLDIFWSIIPIYSDRVDRLRWVIVGVEKLHDTGKVVGFAWGLANEVNMVWNTTYVNGGIFAIKVPVTAKY